TDDALIVSTWPEIKSFDQQLIADFDFASEVISGIRTIRKNKNISFRETIDLKILNNENASKSFDSVIEKLGNVASLEYVNEQVSGALSYRVKSNEYFIPVSGSVNIEEEIKKLEEELKYLQGFLRSVQGKLSNEKFVNGAPEQVIANERKKESDTLTKISTIEQSLAGLK